MRIERLLLKNFRNYSNLDLEIPRGVVVFVGDNAQGKTNLMEAVHLALRGESFRAGQTEVLVKEGEVNAFVKALLKRDGLSFEIDWICRDRVKRLELNGRRSSGIPMARQFPLVLFSPESLSSIKEGPEHRRRLVDDLLVTHAKTAVDVIKEFNKCLKTRNRVLRDFKKGAGSESQTLKLLESLEAIYLPLGVELTCLRLEALKNLESEFERATKEVLQTSERVEIEYLMSGQEATHWDRSQIMDAMHNRLSELRQRELESGLTLVGPHRHDIRFLFAGKDSRYFCSQGQQRALILSYKMAQIMYHYRAHQVYPFLLLDDVLSELDPDRRSNLIRFLKGIPSQIFLTTTDLSFSLDFGDRNFSVFRIDKGVIAGARDSAESLRRRIDSSP